MMENKTFDRLTAGDKFYKAERNSMEYETVYVNEVDRDYVKWTYHSNIPRIKEYSYSACISGRYSSTDVFFFTREADAIRFCKSRMMKNLFKKVDEAKAAINSLKEFRKRNYELLNHEWTERQINILEKQLR